MLPRSSVFLFLLFVIQDVISLNIYVDDFETLSYRPILNRRKREINSDPTPVFLKFRSHNRTFNLKLNPVDAQENPVFSDDHALDVDGTYNSHIIRPHEFLFSGEVIGDPFSHVYGSILDGVFDGHIVLGNGQSYSVEKAARYFDVDERPKNYHSIIYLDDEVNHGKFRTKRSVDKNDFHSEADHGCGLSSEVKAQMEEVQNSAEFTSHAQSTKYNEPIKRKSHLFMDHNEFNFGNGTKRDKRDLRFQSTKEINGHHLFSVRTCSIYLQADQKLYMQIFMKEGNRDHVRTREEIVSLFYNHIKAVNHIYETTNFGGILGLNFVIQRTTIYTNDSCVNGRPAPGSDNPFCEENVDVSNYLNLNSQRNHSAFCLAYALTFRDFVGGTLGLAWVASPNYNTAGGICQVFQRYNEGSRGMVYRSLNTGIVTLVNYGNRVPARVSQLTLAHEIGHNFGSPHDYPAECQPGLPDGNFIMFSSATSGDKPNNARFSSCSVSNISAVLYEVLQQSPVNPQYSTSIMSSKKRNCFQERTSAFCGNQIREPGEECDCGFSDQDCAQMADKCCQPHEVGGRYFGSGACKRVQGALCSPSEGQCCNANTCSPVLATDNRICREESECLLQQKCDGRRAECPDSVHKPNGIPCQDATKVCHSGACNGSICAQVGLKDCFLTKGKPAELCHLACEKQGKCVSTFDLPEFAAGMFHQQGRSNEQGLLLHPGSPCNNYKGYCDIFRKCRSVDANGPLARLKNLLFNKETIQTVSQWSREHWWACVLIGIGVLLVMAIFVKCCAVHTPSTNPNKLPAQHFTDTLRHPGTLLRRGRQRAQATAQAANLQSGQQRSNGQTRPQTVAPSNRRHRQQRQRGTSNTTQQTTGQNRAPANLSAPPLIPPATQTASDRINEPPPPYSQTDPSAPQASTTQPVTTTPAVIPATTGVNTTPVAVPNAPPPPLPSTSTIPITGPPAGQEGPVFLAGGIPFNLNGPKMGRRKKPTTPQKPDSKDQKKGRRSK